MAARTIVSARRTGPLPAATRWFFGDGLDRGALARSLAHLAYHVGQIVLLARIQFGFTIAFHIIFPAFTIGLASYLAVLEGLWLWTGRAVFLNLFKYWLKIFALTFAMWAVMMVGMMLPSATPMILTLSALRRRKAEAAARFPPAFLFAFGYLLTWSGFSLLATLLQWTLDQLAQLSPMLTTTNATLGGALFLLAGLYQLTPLKQACLRHCRSPFAFLFNRWRDGWSGALRMGLAHGAYCLGCCWLLMALLFVVGVMNLLWVAAIALFARTIIRPLAATAPSFDRLTPSRPLRATYVTSRC